MADENKRLLDSFFKSVFSAVSVVNDSGADGKNPGSTIREIIGSLASIAGKGKDEIVQMVTREIGNAVAGVIKEPVTQILKDRKLKITLELIAKDHDTKARPSKATQKKSTSKSKRR